MRRLRLLLAALVVLIAAPSPVVADSPDDDTFVFISSSDGNKFRVTISNGRGGGRRPITSKLTLWRPAISPDGTRIAFSAPIGRPTLGRFGIAVANLDGTGFTMLTTPKYADFSPTWSPDGARLAFVRDRKSNLDAATCCVLRVMDATGSNQATIPGTLGASNPAWSPAGNEIAYDTTDGLHVTDLAGTRSRTIASARRTQAAWSPDGSEIAFVRDMGSEHRLVVADVDGANPRPWYATPQTIESPTWDLDGEAISFVRHGGDGHLGRTGIQVWNVTRAGDAHRLFSSANPIVHLARYTRRGPECDFNGDARSDLAIALTGQDVDGMERAGAVEIMYGTATGLSARNSQQLHRGLNFVAGGLAANAKFGAALVCGDFDGDSYSDLAIGAPGGAGSVTVMYGSADGLTRLGDLWDQDTAGVLGVGNPGDAFGSALGAGDFDGDGFFDLAIGSPSDAIGNDAIGSVNVLYGGPSGLTAADDQLWHQAINGVKGIPQAGDELGAALAAADFDGDGRDDLAIGAPNDRYRGKPIGAVNVLYGTRLGLSERGDQRWHQDSPGIGGAGRAGDRFGASLAAADFGGDGDGDLAIGVPGDTPRNVTAGAINVLYGQPTGLSEAYSDRFHQAAPGIEAAARTGDRFGASLMAGDFDGDSRTDLAIGIPGDTPNNIAAGAVAVLYAQATGLEPAGNQRWYQDAPGVAGIGEAGDRLGRAVATGDFDGDGYFDLAIGVPGEDISGFTNAGVVHALYGQASGISAARDQMWHQGVDGMGGSLQNRDAFGAAIN